ncbi:hypothetical protein B566_EDAN001955 [Ephemera danica]|nr:hypothetical protein B566_EDAN001955 [Ephemera danica]
MSWLRNPGCDTAACEEITLVHVTAEGRNDTLHYIWSFVGRPTLLLAVTEHNTNLFEFRDVNDTGSLIGIPDSDIIALDAEFFEWELKYLGLGPENSVLLEVEAADHIDSHGMLRTGNVTFAISGYGKDGHGSALPHLLHSANCSQMEMTLEGMETRLKGESRFAVVDLLSPETSAGALGGFLQWRPVAYTDPLRQIETSTAARHYSLYNVSLPDYNNTLLFAFYGYEPVLSQTFNISFGVSEDGFYNATNYTVWSVSVGYGQPPAEKLSLLVLLVMGIGLGVPVILMSVGGLYVCLCRRPRAKDELLLSR